MRSSAPRTGRLLAGVGLVLLAVACAEEPGGVLLGEWTSTDHPSGARQTIAFRDDGSAIWTILAGERQVTYDVDWSLDTGPEPHELVLSGFDQGPMAGKTLACLLELEEAADRFRMDCMVADPGVTATPPPRFTVETRTFERHVI